jgi:hypothetical protein
MAVNIEIPLGMVLPDIKREWPGSLYANVDEFSLGFDWGLRGTVNYYFINSFSANIGIGIGNFSDFYAGSADYKNNTYGDLVYALRYTSSYLCIPVGARFNARAFVLGAGLNVFIPFGSTAEGEASDSYFSSDSQKISDGDFPFKPWIGGYFDIGFDLGGRDKKTQGFGMVYRIAASFSKNIVDSDAYDSFKHTTFSIVFNYAFAVANVPIGGKK